MSKSEAIRPRRFQIKRRGQLTHGDHHFACLIHDISELGMFLICNYDLELGLELDVQFELEPGIDFRAKIKVKHFDNGCFGAEIVEADSRSDRALTQFLDSRFSGQSKLPEKRVRV